MQNKNYFLSYKKIIINRIKEYDFIDLLSKISCSSYFLKTSLFEKDIENQKSLMYEQGVIFLTSLYMTKGIISGNKKINYEQLSSLVSDIFYMVKNEEKLLNEESFSIFMSQNTISEAFNKFAGFNIDSFFEYQKDVLADINIDHKDFVNDIASYVNNMYDINTQVEGKSFKEYIDNFEKYNKSQFEYKGKYISIFKKISGRNAAVPSFYSLSNPVSAINKLRSCFIDFNGKLFCFIPSLITGKIIKYISKVIPENHINEWFSNRQKWSEEIVGSLFYHYFPSAKVLINNYYGLPKKRKENDIIVDFKGNLFIVEVKAENITPDSVLDNEEEVKNSFSKQIKKGIEQCDAFYNTLVKEKEIDLLFSNNNKKNFVVDIENYERIIKITVVFEEMGSYLPGFFIREENTGENIVVNIYDLFVILDYLNNPVLTLKYLIERKKIITKECPVYDELIFLGMFTLNDIHFVDVLNETIKNIKIEEKDFQVLIPPDEFTEEIELYYLNQNSKKVKFNINDLILDILNVNFNIISNKELSSLIALLDMPLDVHHKIQSSYNNHNSEVVLNFCSKNKDEKYVMCIKQNQNDCYKICANYFISHPEINDIIIIYYEGKKVKITTVKNTNPKLKKYQKETGLWKRTNY